MATEVWVATAPIYLGNVRAYNLNYIVPDSVVTRFGLDTEGLVERREVDESGSPTHGVNPVTQAELDALRLAVAIADPVLSGFSYDPTTGNLLSYTEDGVTITLTYNSDGTVATSKRGSSPAKAYSYSGGNLVGVA